MLGKAIAWAAQCFEHTKDKGGFPYILHCIRVMNNLHTNDEELKVIAILHDVVEDIFGEDPEKGLDLIKDYYTPRIYKALDLLTHRKETMSYDEYIKNIASNEDARKVKLADLKDNTDITRLKGLRKKDFDRMEKYHRAYVYLNY